LTFIPVTARKRLILCVSTKTRSSSSKAFTALTTNWQDRFRRIANTKSISAHWPSW
jgi:hypothetical protein